MRAEIQYLPPDFLEKYGLDPDAQFACDPDVYATFDDNLGKRGAKLLEDWNALFAQYREKYPQEAKELDAIFNGELPEGWDAHLEPFLHSRHHQKHSQRKHQHVEILAIKSMLKI